MLRCWGSRASANDTPMIQASVRCRDVPADIRRNFVTKVYGILISMLIVSFGLASPFILDRNNAVKFTNENPWIVGVALTLLLLHQVFNLIICFNLLCGGGSCMRGYLRMFMTVPINYVFLYSYAACTGILLGLICAQYKAESVALVFILTAGIMFGLTVYAAVAKTDFTGAGMYICSLLLGLLMLSLVSIFLGPLGPFWQRALAALSAVLFSFVIIYHTQLIFGTASMEFSRSAVRSIEFTVDMYAFAAYQLYLDFVNMFLYLLELFGRRR